MLNELIKDKTKFINQFTKPVIGTKNFISDELRGEYLRWLSSLATYAELHLKKDYPKMTEYVIDVIVKKNYGKDEFCILEGYLDTVEKQEKENEQCFDEMDIF